MPTQDTIVSLSLQKGLETKTDLKQGINGRLLTLENAVFTGVTDIEKRNGYQPLSNSVLGGGSITAGNSLFLLNEQLLINDNENLYSRYDQEQVWNEVSPQSTLSVRSYNTFSNNEFTALLSTATLVPNPIQTPKSAINSQGLQIIVSTSNTVDPTALVCNSKMTYQIIDLDADEIIYESPTIYSVTSPFAPGIFIDSKVITVGDNFVILITTASNNSAVDTDLSYIVVPSTNYRTIGTRTSILTTYKDDNTFDVQSINSQVYLMVKAQTSAQPTLYRYSLSGTNLTLVQGPVKVGPTEAAVYVALSYDSSTSTVFASYVSSSNVVKTEPFSLALVAGSIVTITPIVIPGPNTQTTVPTSLATVVNSGQLHLYYSYSTSMGSIILPYTYLAKYDITTTSVVYLNLIAPVVSIISNPVSINGKSYIVLYNEIDKTSNGSPNANKVLGSQNSQQSYFIVSADNSTTNSVELVARFADQIAAATYATYAINAYDGGGSEGFSSNFNPLQTYNSTLVMPSLIQSQSSSVGYGSGANAQTYIYGYLTTKQFIFDFDVKKSAVTLANSLNFSGAYPTVYDGYFLTEQGYNFYPYNINATITGASGNIAAGTYSYSIIYETLDTVGNIIRSSPSVPVTITVTDNATVRIDYSPYVFGSPFKLANVKTKIYRTSNGGTIYYLLANTSNSVDTVQSYTDTVPDSSIIGSEQLYTTGGEVENIALPASELMTSYKSRIIAVGADGNQWWYSKQVIPGFPVEFSDLFTQNIDQKGGPITAVSTMDDKLIFFKETNVWYVTGNGPAPNGTSNDFSYPQIISSDTGCINQDSILLTPSGLMFQSPKGIYLLARDLTLNYIGAPVEGFNSYPVTSAQMIAGTTQVRFSLSGIDTVLVYDYYAQQWSTFKSISAVDSVIYDTEYTYLDADGVVHTETPSSYLDDTTVIPLNIRTGWIKLSDVQGFERFKKMLLIGSAKGNSTLQVVFYFDYNNDNPYPVEAIPVVGPSDRIQYRIFPPRQKCESFQIVITETPAAGSAGVYSLSNFALEVGLKKGPYKLSAAKSYG